MAPHSTSSTPKSNRRPLKILMLHGYTQSGSLFHAKSRALIKHIQKAFPTYDVTPIYPTGPLRLNPADVPGYTPTTPSTTTTTLTNEGNGHNGSTNGADANDNDQIEAYAWYRRTNSSSSTDDAPLYSGLEEGLATVAQVLRTEGPFDGVIGFSQGAAMAAMVASLLEPGRKEAFTHFEKDTQDATAQTQVVGGIKFPSSFEAEEAEAEADNDNDGVRRGVVHPPFKFAICYSGFRAPGPRYRGFYEQPPIQTSVLHVLGSLDAVVEEARSRLLIEACRGDPEKEGKVVWHPGGHFLPSQRPYLDAVVRFIREQMESATKGESGGMGKEEDDDVRNMNLPF